MTKASQDRNFRKRKVVIAPQLSQTYLDVCTFYKIPQADTSVVFNLCLDTVARGLQKMIAQQRKEQKDATAATTTSIVDEADQAPASVAADPQDSSAAAV